jgi:hypothetical protein
MQVLQGFVPSLWRVASCRLSEANLQVAVVKDGVVDSHEDITQDPVLPSSYYHCCSTPVV